jgi:hypothetical protein
VKEVNCFQCGELILRLKSGSLYRNESVHLCKECFQQFEFIGIISKAGPKPVRNDPSLDAFSKLFGAKQDSSLDAFSKLFGTKF